ncbi:MAG: autotransporter-associated beta strand repeat-containing protein [Verrucomicrobiales bacterium]|nr:autotransporter-associated beta strand repeat-containing protein [Verrucomicrobiales bacterium]
MKSRNLYRRRSLEFAAVFLALQAYAGDVTKDNDTDALNLTTSWVGGVAPTNADVAVWNNTVTAANSTAYGANLDWAGIKITNPGGTVTIGTTGATENLTLGASGIDMSTATQNLLLNGNIVAGAAQIWTVNGGRTLTLHTINTNRTLTGSGNISLAQAGSGTATFTLNLGQNNSTDFTAQGGASGYTGNWTIGANTSVRNLRNGINAWGTGTITMDGGTLGQQQGNWTWTNNITLNTSTTSTFDDFNGSGTTRALKLQGIISGSGNLNINDSSNRMDANNGFILTGANTMSGTITIASSGNLRVGGVTGNDTSLNAGTGGTLGTASVTNNGSLTFSRSNAHTVNNTISGTGVVNVGGTTAAAITGAGTQVLTLSGTNTYTGATTVKAGRLNLTGSLTSATTVASGAAISGTGSTTGLLTTESGASISLAGGGSTTSLTSNGVTFANTAGGTTIRFLTAPVAATTYDVVTYGAGALTNFSTTNVVAFAHGTVSNNVGAQKIEFAADGAQTRTWDGVTATWEQGGAGNRWQEGDEDFYDGDNVIFNEPGAPAIVTINSAVTPGSITVNNTTNDYTFTGTGSIGGTGGLTKNNAGTLTISTANSYTGTTTVNGGTLKLGGSSGTSSLGAFDTAVTKVVVNSGGTVDFNGVADATYGYTIAGTGAAGTGALINSGAGIGNGQKQATNLKLSANATIGGSGNWALLAQGYAATNLDLGGFTLTKQGSNTVGLVTTTINAGTIDIQNGIVDFGYSAGGGSGVSATSTVFTLADTAGAGLAVTKNSSIGSLSGGGATGGNISGSATLTVGALNTDTTYAGSMTGGSLTKTGTGKLTLTGNNTAKNAYTVSNGTLSISGGGGIYRGGYSGNGAGTVLTVGTGGTLELENWGYDESTASLGGLSANAGRFVVDGGTIRMNNSTATSYGRSVTIGSGGATLEANGSALWTIDTVNDSNAWVYNSNPNLTLTGTGNGEFQKVINSGTGGLTKSGSGTWTLKGVNTFSGGTTVSGGTLEIGGAGQLGSGSYAGAIANSGTLKVNSTANQTLSGVVSGGGNLVKDNTGTLTLSGTNTYTGKTTITGGTLLLGANNVLDNASDLDLNGGTLATGNNSDSVDVVQLLSSSVIDMGSGSGSSLTFASNGTWSGTLSVWNWSGSIWTDGPDDLIFTTNSLTAGNLAAIQFYSDGGTTPIGSGAGFIGNNLVPVPEPGAVVAAGLLLGVVGWRGRRSVVRSQRRAA